MNLNRKIWWAAALVALSACNPWSDTKGGTPAIMSSFAAGGNGSDGGTNSVEGVRSGDGTDASPYVWTVPGTTTCDAGETAANEFVVWTKLNKLIDGASVELVPNTCVPAGASATTDGWFTVTQVSGTTAVGTAAEETSHWYSCYYPSTASASEGASIIFYRTADARDWATTPPTFPGTLASGESFWDLASLPVRNDDVITYTIDGAAADKAGTPLPIHIVFQSLPDSGAVDLGVTAVTGAPEQASSVTLEWNEGSCATAKEYVLQRANADGTWASIFTETLGGTPSFVDSTVAYGSKYDYRIVEVITGAQTGTDFTQVKATKTATVLLIPAAPTLSGATASTMVVTFTEVPGATGYTIERAIDLAGAPGDFITAGTVAAVAPFTDTGLDPSTAYWWRIVANNAVGSSEPSVAATATTTAAP